MPKRKPTTHHQHGAWIPDDIWVGTPFDKEPIEALRTDFRTNKYRAPCLACLEPVPAGAGGLVRLPSGAWAAQHLDCDAA